MTEDPNQQRRLAALALPKSLLPNLAAWVERSRQFYERMQNISEDLVPQFSITEPLSADDVGRFSESLRIPLPPSLRRFFTEAAGEWSFYYRNWDPGPVRVETLRRRAPDIRGGVWGGGEIGPLIRLGEFQEECLEYAEGSWLTEWPGEQRQWLSAVPFLRMASGDMLALDPEYGPDDPPVLCLCHDGESELVAPNLAAFLKSWEALCYIGPEPWMLAPFCDGDSGCLNHETAQAQALRDVFSHPFEPVVVKPGWRSATVARLADSMAQDRAFNDLPILADALEEAGCDNATILQHLRTGEKHGPTCWVVDLLLRNE